MGDEEEVADLVKEVTGLEIVEPADVDDMCVRTTEYVELPETEYKPRIVLELGDDNEVADVVEEMAGLEIKIVEHSEAEKVGLESRTEAKPVDTVKTDNTVEADEHKNNVEVKPVDTVVNDADHNTVEAEYEYEEKSEPNEEVENELKVKPADTVLKYIKYNTGEVDEYEAEQEVEIDRDGSEMNDEKYDEVEVEYDEIDEEEELNGMSNRNSVELFENIGEPEADETKVKPVYVLLTGVDTTDADGYEEKFETKAEPDDGADDELENVRNRKPIDTVDYNTVEVVMNVKITKRMKRMIRM